MISPWWRSATIRREMSSPRPVPLPTSLVVKNGSNARACTSAASPRRCRPNSTTTHVAVGPRSTSRSVPLTVHGVDRVVDEVRPHLVELAGVRLDLGERRRRSRGRSSTPSPSLWPEHHEGALDALGDVDRAASDARSSCEYDFTVSTRAEIRPVDVLHLVEQRRAANVLATHVESRAPASSPSSDLGDPLAPLDVDAGGRERRGDLPGLVDAVLVQPVDSSSSRSASASGSTCRGRRVDLPAQRVDRDELLGGERPPPPRCDERGQQRRRRSPAARRPPGVAAEAGLLISWASPAAERPERDQRLALARQRLHVAHRLEEALDQVDAEREPASHQLAERHGGIRNMRPSLARPAGRQVPGSSDPRPGSRRPTPRVAPSSS